MSETKQGFQYIKQVAIGAVSGLALLALIIAGFGLSGGLSAPTSTSTQAGPSAAPSVTPSASASSLRTCSVAEQAADPLLALIREKEAAEAERASIKYKQVEYMSKRLGKSFTGVISGITEWGMYIEELETKCEGMVRLRDMSDDFYVFNEKKLELIGQKKNKKFVDFLLRKGYETNLIFEKLKQLDN